MPPSDSSGMVATIFKFGNVSVQTAGAVDRFAFNRIPNPELVEKTVLDLYEQRAPNKPIA